MAAIVVIPKTVREKLGDDGANDFVRFLNLFWEQKRQEIIKDELYEINKLDLKFEKRLGETENRIVNEIIILRSELKSENEKLRSEFRSENAKLRSEFKGENEKLRSDFKGENEKLRSESKIGIGSVRSELKVEIAESRAEIIKWMFIFWIGTVLTIVGSLLGFLKLFLGK